MGTVFFLNNYDMTTVRRLVADGVYPAHHLWGYPTDARTSPFEWSIAANSIHRLPLLKREALSPVRRAIVRLIGDPLPQLDVLRHARAGDIVYSADQVSALLVCALKRLGWFRRPAAVLLHHRPRSAWERWCLGGIDVALVLSDVVGDEVSRTMPDVRVVRRLPWGPDLGSPVYRNVAEPPSDADEEPDAEPGSRLDFVAAGRTNRDYGLLAEAARRGRLDGRIYDTHGMTEFREGVAGDPGPGGPDYSHMPAVMDAAAVVIPLRDPHVVSGFTEVADAIALGKPVVITRSDVFPIDVEAEGAGLIVEPGDVDGMAEAILAARAGKAGNAAVLGDTYNLERFTDELEDLLLAAMAPGESPATVSARG